MRVTLRTELSVECSKLLEDHQGVRAAVESRQHLRSLHRTQVPLLDLQLVARLGARDRAVLRCAGHFYHQTWCAQLREEALRIHAAEQALGSLPSSFI